MTTSRVDIDRVPLALLAATTPARAERLARQVRDAVAAGLPGALAGACGRTLDQDDAYVFIDRLSVQCAVAAHWDDDTIGRAFGERVAAALLREVAAAPTIVFRDRTEYLAAFISALVDGHAFSRWWFDEFDGLAKLPVSAALRTLIVQEHFLGVRALAQLTADARRRVLSVLTAADARRIVDGVLAGRGGEADGAAVSRLLAAVERLDLLAARDPATGELARLVVLESMGVGAATRVEIGALGALATLYQAARDGVLDDSLSLDRDPATVLIRCGERLHIPIAQMAGLASREPAAFVERLRSVAPAPTPATVGVAAEFAYTIHGGAVLLCALLARLGWWAEWSQRLDDTRAAWLALDVVARALNPRRPSAVARDPVVRALFGASGTRAGSRGRRAALGSLGAVSGAARALLEEFAKRVPGCADSTPAYLRGQCLTLPAVVSSSSEQVRARVGRPPLDVLIGLSGLKRAVVALPDGRTLVVTEES